MRGWALWYAGQGWPVFPVHGMVNGVCTCRHGTNCQAPGKHPAVRRGWKDASLDANQIKSWWDENPSYNVALATGSVTVVDIDGQEGLRSFKKLLGEYGQGSIKMTPRAATGGGGWHLFFQGVDIKNLVGVRPGIDIRSRGGYVILPPSRHKSGRPYSFDRCPTQYKLQPFPAWLFKVAEERKPAFKVKVGEDGVKRINIGEIGEIANGQRNNTLARICGRLFFEGNEAETVLALLAAVNQMHCNPPVSKQELKTIVNSIYQRRVAEGQIKGANHDDSKV